MKEVSKWIGISGSWRVTNPKIEGDVRARVRDIVISGNGIITGGALNVDYQVTDEILKLGKEKQLRIFLPTTLQIYATHYRKRAQEGVITSRQAEDLILQLQTFQHKNPNGLIENPNNTEVNKDTYYERNSEVVNASDELIAFQVNDSAGTQDTINKANAKGIPVTVLAYEVK
jgi:hypothetical protein